MKIKSFVGLFILVLSFCFLTTSASASRGTGSAACTAEDLSQSPFGWLCGTSPAEYQRVSNFKITAPGYSTGMNTSSSVDPEDDSDNAANNNVNEGDDLSITASVDTSAAFNGTAKPQGKNGNGQAQSMLVWFTFNTSSGSAEDYIKDNLTSYGTGTVSLCPGVDSNANRPGKVWGYRDVPSSQYSSTTYSNGPNQVPFAYNPSNGKGVVNCGVSGAMLYYEIPYDQINNNSFSFKIKPPESGLPTDIPQICARMNVSVRYNGDSLFPAKGSGNDGTPHQEDAAANRLIKQSKRVCFSVTKAPSPPAYTGYINGDCGSLHGRLVKTGSSAKVNFKIQVWGGTSWLDYQLNMSTDNTKPYPQDNFSTPINGDQYFGNGVDKAFRFVISDGTVKAGKGSTTTGYVFGGDFNCHDDPVYMLMSTTCTQVRLYDASDPDPDGGQNMHAQARVYQRNSDGSRGNYITTVEKTFHAQGSDTAALLDIGKVVPDANNNHGVYVEAEIQNIVPGGPYGYQGTWGAYARTADAAVGACYDATCSLSVPGNLPGGSGAQVMAGGSFTVNASITNSGDSDNQPLYDDLGGNQLTLTDGGGNVDFGPVDWSYDANYTLGVGGTDSSSPGHTFTVTAPNSIGTYTVDAYVDYNGRFAVYSSPSSETDVVHCTATFKTYQPYEVTPTAQITSVVPDSENPNSISYTTSNGRKSGAYSASYPGVNWYTSNINSNASARLYYLPKGSASAKPNDYDSTTYSNLTYGTPTYTRTWNDTLPDVPQFNHGGTIDTWIRDDKACPAYTVDAGFGWVGPDGQILTEARTADDCAAGTGGVQDSDRPFVRVYGNDVMAGGNFPSGVSGGGPISTYSRGTIAPAGSGGEFAAMALGAINGYTSASLRSVDPLAPNGLSFANDSGTPGTLFGPTGARQTTDWYEDTRKAETTQGNMDNTNATSIVATGQQIWTKPSDGMLNIGGTINYTGRRAVYVEGDVLITSNITFSNVRANINDIPSFVIIAKGNIYISRDVTQLDGVYVAQPKDISGGKNNDTNSGRIYTCTRTDGSRFTSFELANQANCGSKLQINGSLVAQDVRFLRTYGTLKNVPVTQVSAPAPTTPGYDLGWKSYTGPPAIPQTDHCTEFYEDSDPIWGGPSNYYRDNFLCWNGGAADDFIFLHGGTTMPGGYAPSNFPASTCLSMNNPNETPGHTWGDNYLCAKNSLDAQLEVHWDGTQNPAKQCINIHENGEPGAWGTGKVWLCFKKTVVGLPTPVKYLQETYDGPNTDHAGESIRTTPETYLSKPVFRPLGSQSNGKYDYIITLPPVL